MTYSTRRLSAQQDSSVPIPIRVSASPSSATSPLSSSAGKSRRTPTSAASTRRRLSSSASSSLRPGISVSPASGSTPLPHSSSYGTKARSAVTPSTEDDAEDGEVKGAALAKANKGQLYGCEVCGKVYRHSTCLVKHRWEHTAHWKEASKLLLSKHQQVQLLEAAAILQVASAGSSLPEEKSYWPAAVSPPSSGLLGSQSLNINLLTSPRLNSSLALPASLPNSERDTSPPDEALEDVGEEDDEELESVSTGDDLTDGMTEGMFDMDLDSEPVTVDGRAGSVGEDSGYGSLGAMGSSTSSKLPHPGPRLGFFDAGRNSPSAVI